MQTELLTPAGDELICEIQWDALKAAFENHSGGAKTVLDRNTGEVLDFGGGLPASTTNRATLLTIVPVPSRVQYQMMETFIGTVKSTDLRALLHENIVGKGAFRRFKDALADYPDERKRWFAFRDALLHQYILSWLEENHVTYANPPQWSLELPMALEDLGITTIEEETPAVETQNAVKEQELNDFIMKWAKNHGQEFGYVYGPTAFDALCNDLNKAFSFSKRV